MPFFVVLRCRRFVVKQHRKVAHPTGDRQGLSSSQSRRQHGQKRLNAVTTDHDRQTVDTDLRPTFGEYEHIGGRTVALDSCSHGLDHRRLVEQIGSREVGDKQRIARLQQHRHPFGVPPTGSIELRGGDADKLHESHPAARGANVSKLRIGDKEQRSQCGDRVAPQRTLEVDEMAGLNVAIAVDHIPRCALEQVGRPDRCRRAVTFGCMPEPKRELKASARGSGHSPAQTVEIRQPIAHIVPMLTGAPDLGGNEVGAHPVERIRAPVDEPHRGAPVFEGRAGMYAVERIGDRFPSVRRTGHDGDATYVAGFDCGSPDARKPRHVAATMNRHEASPVDHTSAMGLRDKARDVKQAMAIARNGVVDLSQLTPEQRARYDANMERVTAAQAESQASWQQAQTIRENELDSKVLRGAAAEQVYGARQMSPSPDETTAQIASAGQGSVLRQALQQSATQFKEAATQAVGRDGPPEVDDPPQRLAITAHERAARDHTRFPYLSPTRQDVAIARISTRGGTQIEDLIAKLGESGLAARPDLVFGIYRVPDRISPTLSTHSEKARVVEWDIVHVPGALTPVAPQVMAAYFRADLPWVRRRPKEPSLLDEDLPLAYLTWAGVGPEQCFGVARFPHFRHSGRSMNSEETPPIRSLIEGTWALHSPVAAAGGIVDSIMANAPIELPAASLPLAYIEVLDWTEVARVVHPHKQRPYRVPSPFPILPSTPQEVLTAYLDIVGVQASDCYSAQVTVTEPRQVIGSTTWIEETNIGPSLPCIDGKSRMRIQAAQDVVIAYRDRPEYVAGRERWAAYQRDGIEAILDLRSWARPEVPYPGNEDIANPILRRAADVLSAVDRLSDALEFNARRLPPVRYCWPPTP